jgi:Dihaem cytochrome c
MHACRTERPNLLRMSLLAISTMLAIVFAGCTRKPLPNAYSPQAMLYVERCGQCHAPYYPGSMTADMWQVQVLAMEDKMRQAGLPPLSDEDRAAILDYLSRNAEK